METSELIRIREMARGLARQAEATRLGGLQKARLTAALARIQNDAERALSIVDTRRHPPPVDVAT